MGSGRLSRHAVSASVVAGGAAGALLRFGLDQALPVRPGGWPWATFTANLVGAALLGYVATRLLERLPPSPRMRPLLGTGLCGALTTFSSLQVEAIGLARDGHPGLAATYVGTSIGGGLLCVVLAGALVRRARLGAA
ncbi:fluoride efflux transporter CrcB [Miltoncostaea marina]|uniref:fluoride efflux transporter CrcB n=1 Tax=Miltoncostaea marina TaxID=2843215 RepID=UPI001C3DE807|nr:fluoride efflux transporter CrcB [Miltoncostaea marina]